VNGETRYLLRAGATMALQGFLDEFQRCRLVSRLGDVRLQHLALVVDEAIVTDGLRSYGAALKALNAKSGRSR
jgi:hypothetical protein